MNLQPLADRIVLEQLDSEEKTASGIILPDSAKEKPSEGKVLAVGSDVKEVKVDGKELMIAKEEDVLAVIKK